MNTLSHDTLLFNVHDLVLLMAASQYLLLAVLLFATRRKSDQSSYLLAGMLMITALQSVDTVLIWSTPLRQAILEWNPNFLFLGSFSYWLQGPLLYGYVASVLYREFRLRWRDLLHVLPAAIIGVILISQYYLLPASEKVALMDDMRFMWSPLMKTFITGWHLSVIIYGSACLVLLWRYRRQLQQHYANVEDRERRWLTWIILGFVLIAAWKLLVHLLGERLGDDISNLMGIASHYFVFLFVNSLVFVSIRYTHLFTGLSNARSHSDSEPYKPEQVRRVEEFMTNEKPYLTQDISLEILARRLSLPERTLSRILNQHFGKNFFEFINSYRVEEAKKLLASPACQNWTMLDILAESGFTSKSTFNAIFKKQVGQTPSQYRQSVS